MLRERWSSATVVESAEDTCPYCTSLLKSHLGAGQVSPWNTVLYESPNFVVVPTLGSLVEGWLLIVSKAHLLCMGALPESHGEELKAVARRTVMAVTRTYQQPTIFEHGPSACSTPMGCGVDHAHLHVVPLGFGLRGRKAAVLSTPELEWHATDEWFAALRALYNERKQYLFLAEPGAPPMYCTPANVPNQVFRRAVAQLVGKPGAFDYHEDAGEENVLLTVRRLRDAFTTLSAKKRP